MTPPAPAALLALPVLLLLVGCSPAEEALAAEPPASAAREALLVVEAGPTRLTGTLPGSPTPVDFDARAEDSRRAVVTLTLGGRTLRGTLDRAAHQVALEGGGAVLEEGERAALAALAAALPPRLGAAPEALPSHAQALLGLLAYWSEAPAHYVHRARLAPLGALDSPGEDGVTCVRRGAPVRCRYGRPEASSVEYVVAGARYGAGAREGASDCVGRCGAGCTGAEGRYTLDCLELDICRYREAQAGAAPPPSCQQAYEEALDDFLLPSACGR